MESWVIGNVLWPEGPNDVQAKAVWLAIARVAANCGMLYAIEWSAAELA